MGPFMDKHLLRFLQPLFIALAVILMVWLLAQQWEELRAHPWRLHGGWLSLSVAGLAASWALEIAIWRQLLRLVGGQLPYWPAARIWFLSAIVRYIPGNVWQPLSLTLRCQRRGVDPAATLTSVVLYQAILLLAVVPLTALYFGWSGNVGPLGEIGAAAGPEVLVALTVAGLVPVAIFLLRPGWLLGCINWALVKVGRAPLTVTLSSGWLLYLLLLAALDWLLWGATFAAVTFALIDSAPATVAAWAPHLIVAYPVAYAIGYLSFITPSGFGVREGALVLLLAPLLGGSAVTVAALAMRFWTTLGELVAALISGLFDGPSPQPVVPVSTSTAPEHHG